MIRLAANVDLGSCFSNTMPSRATSINPPPPLYPYSNHPFPPSPTHTYKQVYIFCCVCGNVCARF